MVRDATELFARAAGCTACPGMGCPPVLSAANGSLTAQVLFVGEAPGRFGAGKTGVPFSGDVAGRRFEQLLEAAGLQREHVFVTNAVLCLPLDAGGRNRTPAAREVRECSSWLADTIAQVNPLLVVAMGRVALEGLRLVAPHGLSLLHAGEEPRPWNGRKLAVTYHPGARSAVHRPWEQQVEDWQSIGAVLSGAGWPGRNRVDFAHEF